MLPVHSTYLYYIYALSHRYDYCSGKQIDLKQIAESQTWLPSGQFLASRTREKKRGRKLRLNSSAAILSVSSYFKTNSCMAARTSVPLPQNQDQSHFTGSLMRQNETKSESERASKVSQWHHSTAALVF